MKKNIQMEENNMDLIDALVKAKKRKNELIIKTLPEILQVARNWAGAYDMNSGIIEVGSTEKETPTLLWHEQLHKYLFEKESLESGIMWDNIANAIEEYIELPPITIPYTFTLPVKKAKPFKREMKKWLGKLEPESTFGLGITTYKSGEIKNYKNEAEKISNLIRKELIENLDLKVISSNPTIGIYKGGKEPSYSPILKGRLTDKIRETIKNFKTKYNQESVILYKFGGIKNVGIEISNIPEHKINELQDRIIKVTGGKIGGFMSHHFDMNRLTIINVPGFDQLTKSQFSMFIPEIRKEVRALGGNMKSFSLDVEVL